MAHFNAIHHYWTKYWLTR